MQEMDEKPIQDTLTLEVLCKYTLIERHVAFNLTVG
jgi:hypothetical protein